MTDPEIQETLTDAEKARALRLAAESVEGAPERWAERVARGQSNEQLARALEYEFGEMGGCSRDNIGVTYQRNGLKIWADHCIGSRSRPPILEGKQTVSFARRVYGIPDPDEKQMALF
jgi:hypothetical protein